MKRCVSFLLAVGLLSLVPLPGGAVKIKSVFWPKHVFVDSTSVALFQLSDLTVGKIVKVTMRLNGTREYHLYGDTDVDSTGYVTFYADSTEGVAYIIRQFLGATASATNMESVIVEHDADSDTLELIDVSVKQVSLDSTAIIHIVPGEAPSFKPLRYRSKPGLAEGSDISSGAANPYYASGVKLLVPASLDSTKIWSAKESLLEFTSFDTTRDFIRDHFDSLYHDVIAAGEYVLYEDDPGTLHPYAAEHIGAYTERVVDPNGKYIAALRQIEPDQISKRIIFVNGEDGDQVVTALIIKVTTVPDSALTGYGWITVRVSGESLETQTVALQETEPLSGVFEGEVVTAPEVDLSNVRLGIEVQIVIWAPSTPSGLSRQGFLRPTFTFTSATPFQEGASLTYTVQVSTESDFSNVTASESGITENASGTTSWTITRDLTENATYYWRVRAEEGNLIGSFSAGERFRAVLLQGDFNDDGVVDLKDFFLFATNFNQPATGDRVKFDLNIDGSINLADFFVFVDDFGTTVDGKGLAFAHLVDREARLSLEATGGSRAEAGLITVRVWAEQIRDLRAFGLVLGFEDDVLDFQQAVKGPGHLLESRGGEAPLFRVLSQRPGELVLANAITHGDPVSGRGLLAEVTFQTLTGAPTNEALFYLRQAFIVGKDSDQVRRIVQLTSTRLVPATYFLGANFPNPFNPTTTIDYALPTASATELLVFDILGRRVRTLIRDEAHPAGFYQTTWDGRDESGRTASNGVYFYRLSSRNFHQTGKMMLLK